MRRRAPVWALALALVPSTALGALPRPSDRAGWREILRWPASCERDFPRGVGAGIDIEALDGGRRLVTVSCLVGAYQGEVRVYVLSRSGQPTLLRFRDPEEAAGGGLRSRVRSQILGSLVVDRTGRIEVLNRFRGIGDCGILAVHRLTGVNTRLVSVRAKLECGGNPAVPPGRWPGVPLSEIARA